MLEGIADFEHIYMIKYDPARKTFGCSCHMIIKQMK